MAKPNYAFAKRQRDLAKKQKKEEKKLRKTTPVTEGGEGMEGVDGVDGGQVDSAASGEPAGSDASPQVGGQQAGQP